MNRHKSIAEDNLRLAGNCCFLLDAKKSVPGLRSGRQNSTAGASRPSRSSSCGRKNSDCGRIGAGAIAYSTDSWIILARVEQEVFAHLQHVAVQLELLVRVLSARARRGQFDHELRRVALLPQEIVLARCLRG